MSAKECRDLEPVQDFQENIGCLSVDSTTVASTKKLNIIWESFTLPISRWLYFSVFCCFNSTIVLLRCNWRPLYSPPFPSSSCPPLFDFFRGCLMVYEFLSLAITLSIVVYELAGILIELGEMVHSTGL